MTDPEVPHADLIAKAIHDIIEDGSWSGADELEVLLIAALGDTVPREQHQRAVLRAAGDNGMADLLHLADHLEAAERERDEARAERDALAAQLAELRSMHKAKHGENDRGPYIICDYDKTRWPCRTYMILAAAIREETE